jgi:hypothetical protein
MKKFLFLFALILSSAFVWLQSCKEEKEAVAEISFSVDNLTDFGKKSGDETIPECKDLTASYVKIFLNGKWYTLDLVDVGIGNETQVIKLPEGTYSIEEFIVYAENGEVLQASPHENSYYDNLFNFDNNVVVEFKSEAFHKYKITVDVLCFNEPDYDKFNFEEFVLDNSEVNSMCFFGDVCTKLWKEWSVYGDAETNPYFGWPYMYDMYAVYEVAITDQNGNTVTNSNYPFDPKNPDVVCVEYLDYTDVADETYHIEISLFLPDGSKEMIYAGDVNEANVADLLGEDGVFTFALGDCNFEGNDIEAVLPLEWVALPDQIVYTLYDNGSNSYYGLEIESLVGFAEGQIKAPSKLNAWCGDKNVSVAYNHKYLANVYAWYEASNLTGYTIDHSQVEKLNWIVNNVNTLISSSSYMEVQRLIWDVLGYTSGSSTLVMPDVTGYVPPLGGWVIVFIEPIQDLTAQSTCNHKYQLAIVRLDP